MVNDIIKQVRVNGVNGDPNIDYDIAVDVDRVIFRNTEGDATTDTTLKKILFENDNIASPFLRGEQSIVGYINDGNTVRDKISFGIYALVNGNVEIWDSINNESKYYISETSTKLAGEFLGSFVKKTDIQNYVLVYNENYGKGEESSDYQYRTLTTAEVERYFVNEKNPDFSLLQRYVLADSFSSLLKNEDYTSSTTITIANRSEIASIFE